VMGEIEELLPWGELAMPVPGLELASGYSCADSKAIRAMRSISKR
jgi:hypothetical protein